MSYQSQAKQEQGYRTTPNNCGNCAHFSFTMNLPEWCREQNEKARKQGHANSEPYPLKTYGIESAKRCNLGGFAVKKTATCDKWAPTEVTE